MKTLVPLALLALVASAPCPVSAALCPVSAAQAAESPGSPESPVVAETLLADGTTNTWTQADLVDALGLLNRRYRRDIETREGRRAWHGREVSQTPCTNAAGALVMRRVYADGFAYDEPARALSGTNAARVALNRRALLATNGVSPRLAARRLATSAAPVLDEVTVSVDATPRRARPAYDDYGNVTNCAPAAQEAAK